LGDLSGTGSNVGLATREVVGHLSIEFLYSLLLGTSLATSTALSTATSSLTASTCGTWGSLLDSSRLWLVLPGLSYTVGKRRWASCNRDSGGADEHLDPDRATINLDTIESSGGLGGLVVLVEDDSSATDAAALGIVLEKNLLGATYTNS
jgi:hypothetical protein